MNEQQIQSDIYFQGSKDQLFALLYPLTGPSSQIFAHLETEKINFNNNEKKLQFVYKTKDFSNIDRQQQSIVYQSTSLSTHSNYFYSTYLPEDNAYVWRSVHRMVQMRPVRIEQSQTKKEAKLKQKSKNLGEKNKKGLNQMQVQIPLDQSKVQLNLVQFQAEENKPRIQIKSAPSTQKLNKNWDISKDQYLSRLCE